LSGPHSVTLTCVGLWRVGRIHLLLLLRVLTRPLLHLGQFLALSRGKHCQNLREGSLLDFLNLGALLIHAHAGIVAHGVNLTHFVLDDGLQFRLLVGSELQLLLY
jgi:hypothetical protein